jgi:hypothetical protein
MNPDEKDPMEIDWECDVCGESLQVRSGGRFLVIVEPCKKCLQNKYDEGYQNGYSERDTELYKKEE